MQTEAELRAHIAMEAAEDDDFRARLVADPRAAVEAETALATDAHLVLPPKPELSQQQLDRIAGGFLAARVVDAQFELIFLSVAGTHR